MLEFSGPATPLSDDDLEAAATKLGLEPALVAAVDAIESRGSGFLPDGRPKILFEAHAFYRETEGKFGTSNVSSPTWDRSLYGAAGAHQYERLAAAINAQVLPGKPMMDAAAIRAAALRSASWGRYQVMGFNHATCGYPDVEAFVAAMVASERAHLGAFVAYCEANHLVEPLRKRDWAAFARGYNGPGQVAKYAADLAKAYEAQRARWASRPALSNAPGAASPVETSGGVQDGASNLVEPMKCAVRAVQALLVAAGLDPGKIDGVWGDATDLAYVAFRDKTRGERS